MALLFFVREIYKGYYEKQLVRDPVKIGRELKTGSTPVTVSFNFYNKPKGEEKNEKFANPFKTLFEP